MVAGHLQEKNGVYYAVLSYRDAAGKRKQPWINTGLPVKGNKKKAEKKLDELRKKYEVQAGGSGELCGTMLFADYMEHWLKIIKGSVEITTYSSYSTNVKKKIVPYFREKNLTWRACRPSICRPFICTSWKPSRPAPYSGSTPTSTRR